MPKGPTFKDGGSGGSDFRLSKEEFMASSDDGQQDTSTTSTTTTADIRERATTTSEVRTQRQVGDTPTATAAEVERDPGGMATGGPTRGAPVESDRATVTRTGAEQLETARTDQRDQRDSPGPPPSRRRATDGELPDVAGIRDRPGGDVAAGILAVGAAPAVAEPTPFGEIGVAGAAGAALVGGAAATVAAEQRGVFGESEIPVTRGQRTFVERPEIPVSGGAGATAREQPELPVGQGQPVQDIDLPARDPLFERPEIRPSEPAREQPDIPISGPTGDGATGRGRARDETVVPEEFPLPGRDFPANPRQDVIRPERDLPGAETGAAVRDQPTAPTDLPGPTPPTIGEQGREEIVGRDFPTGGEAVVGREVTEPTIEEGEFTTPAVEMAEDTPGDVRDRVLDIGPSRPAPRGADIVGTGVGAAGATSRSDTLDPTTPDRDVVGDVTPETGGETAPQVGPDVENIPDVTTGTGTSDELLSPPAFDSPPAFETPPDLETPPEHGPEFGTPTETVTDVVPGTGPGGGGTPGPGPGELPLPAFGGGGDRRAREEFGVEFSKEFVFDPATPGEVLDVVALGEGEGLPDFDNIGGGNREVFNFDEL